MLIPKQDAFVVAKLPRAVRDNFHLATRRNLDQFATGACGRSTPTAAPRNSIDPNRAGAVPPAGPAWR